MINPKVSVVMVVHNEEPFIAEAIQSALDQGYPNLEVIVADDGSTDDTPAIAARFAERYPERVVLVPGDRNEGKSVAGNRALAAVSGELIAWLDGDDVMLPGKIATQVKLLERRPDAVGCWHDAEVFNSETGEVLGRFSAIYNRRPLREGGVVLWFDPTYRNVSSTMMFRAAAAPEHGLDRRLRVAHDWLFDIELFRRGPCVACQDVLVRYRRHSGQLTDREHGQVADAKRRSAQLEEPLMVMAIVEARYPELQTMVRRCRAALILWESRQLARSGDHKLALQRAWGAFRTGGFLAIGRAIRNAHSREGGLWQESVEARLQGGLR